MHRRIKNHRLADAGYRWAFTALTASPGARAHYDRRRHAGDLHAAAQRNLFNRLIGCLHHCLATGQPYQETIAFPPATAPSKRRSLTPSPRGMSTSRRQLYRTLTVTMTPTITNNPAVA